MSEFRLYICRMIFTLLPEMSAYRVKNALLRWAGVSVGRGCRICSSVHISGNGRLEIGEGTWIGTQALIRASPGSMISIGKNVDIAPRVTIWTGTHPIMRGGHKAAGPGQSKDIVIVDGAWIAAGTIITPGTIIGECSVCAAGSVVVEDVAARTLVAGVPAQVKRGL